MMTDLSVLPESLLAPSDDNAARHLKGMNLPALRLLGTDYVNINLAELKHRHVIYIYPMTGRPDTPLPDSWIKYLERVVAHHNPVHFVTIMQSCRH